MTDTKIPINKQFDIIIVEKSNGNTIECGSLLFCGCCGNPVAELKREISFPFDSVKLKKHCRNWTLENMPIGVRHKTCGHTMFSFKKLWGFISAEKYLEQYLKQTTIQAHQSQTETE